MIEKNKLVFKPEKKNKCMAVPVLNVSKIPTVGNIQERF